MKKLSFIKVSFKTFIILFSLQYLEGQVSEIGTSQFQINHEGSSVLLPYYSNINILENNNDKTRAVIVIHGEGRQAYNSYDQIYNVAESENKTQETIIVAPQFLTTSDVLEWDLSSSYCFWSGATGWTGGSMNHSISDHPTEYLISSFTIMDSLLTHLNHVFTNLNSIIVIGHSAGGQFVNRYAGAHSLQFESKIKHVVSAPSHYLYFNEERVINEFVFPLEWGVPINCSNYNNYRYGLENLNNYMAQVGQDSIIHRYKRRAITYIVGSEDFGGTTDCQSLAQGENRKKRSLTYYNYINHYFGSSILETQKLAIISGADHDSGSIYNSNCVKSVIFETGNCSQLEGSVHPIANFSGQSFVGVYPLEYSFFSESTSNYDISSVFWDFGDGQTSNRFSGVNTYNKPGVYSVSLEVTDIIGFTNLVIEPEVVRIDTVFGDLNFNGLLDIDDASKLLEGVVDASAISTLMREVGDVTKNGDISAYDSRLIAQISNGLIDPVDDQVESVNGQIILNDIVATPGDIIEVPIKLMNGENILGLSLSVEYNSQVVEYGAVQKGAILELDETTVMKKNIGELGVINLAAYSLNSYDGTGNLFSIYFILKDTFLDSTTLAISNIVFNETSFFTESIGVISAPLKTKNSITPTGFSLNQNYPNPFNPQTEISFTTNKSHLAKLTIYNIRGEKIKNIFNKKINPGSYKTTWDGCDLSGRPVSSGTYFYQIKTKSFEETKKMILLR